ncbi:hypothetical protein SALBM311S_05067 [Streptomyces alboniger]
MSSSYFAATMLIVLPSDPPLSEELPLPQPVRASARASPPATCHGGTPTQLGLTYDLSSAGHWYGHGEAETPQGGPGTNQPWPLDPARSTTRPSARRRTT